MKLLVPLLAIVSLALIDSSLTYRATKGAKLERHISQKTTYTLESLTQVSPAGRVDDNESKASGSVELALAVTDEFANVADGRVLRLKRTFDEVQSTATVDLSDAGQEISLRIPSKSPLAKRTVSFDRKKAEDAFTASLDAEKSALSEVLDGLAEDLDLRALLPKEAVKVGESWEPPATALAHVLEPGGALAIEPDTSVLEKMPPANVLVPYQAMLVTLVGPCDNAEKIEGDVECTWKETNKKDGHELARIEFEIDVTTKADHTKEIVRRLEAAGLPTDGAPPSSRSEGKLRGKGHFTWDLTAGRATDLEASLDWRVTMVARWKADAGEVGIDVALAGTTELEYACSEP